jgi:hypothetical protein
VRSTLEFWLFGRLPWRSLSVSLCVSSPSALWFVKWFHRSKTNHMQTSLLFLTIQDDTAYFLCTGSSTTPQCSDYDCCTQTNLPQIVRRISVPLRLKLYGGFQHPYGRFNRLLFPERLLHGSFYSCCWAKFRWRFHILFLFGIALICSGPQADLGVFHQLTPLRPTALPLADCSPFRFGYQTVSRGLEKCGLWKSCLLLASCWAQHFRRYLL